MPDSFWSQITGRLPVAAPPQPAEPSVRPWWQDDIYTPPAPAGPALQGVSLAGQGITTEQLARQAVAEGHDISRAQHFRHEDNCPGCNSGDYLSPPGGGRKRCFDCGYPIIQRGSGLTLNSGGKGSPARQVASGGGIVHNYQPTIIADRIT